MMDTIYLDNVATLWIVYYSRRRSEMAQCPWRLVKVSMEKVQEMGILGECTEFNVSIASIVKIA